MMYLCVTFLCIQNSFYLHCIPQKLDAKVDGVSFPDTDGIHFKLDAPFEFMGSTVGFRGDVKDLINLKPDSFFWRKKLDGGISVNAEHSLDDRVTSVAAKWSNDDLAIEAEGNTKDLFTGVNAQFKTTMDEAGRAVKAKIHGAYDVVTSKISTKLGLSSGDISGSVAYDTASEEPVVAMSYKLDSRNSVQPTVNLKTKDVTYGLSHELDSGSLDMEFRPNDNIKIDWTDKAASGNWKTTIDYPFDSRDTKVGFSRIFDY